MNEIGKRAKDLKVRDKILVGGPMYEVDGPIESGDLGEVIVHIKALPKKMFSAILTIDGDAMMMVYR